jgi:hypothetical protein
MKRLVLLILILFAIFFSMSGTTAFAAGDEPSTETVILSASDDPYYSLAEEISDTEGYPIYQTFENAAEARPVFLLWVVAPENLSESVLMDFSAKLKELDTSISIGIISGKTIEDARGLWKGSTQLSISNYAIINGTKKNKIEPKIISGYDSQTSSTELTMKNIQSILQHAGAIQISLEGAAGLWFDQSLGITVKSKDIPEMDGCIIQHYGCSTFRPWAENSIALACISKGVAAYCGFVYPSITGTRFGDYTDISIINTWNKFPLGHLVQLQNHAAMQNYADIPHYFMLGDPRIYCRSEAPYETVSDKTNGNTRIIKLSNVKSGLIPVYIEDGAGYNFISVPGLASSAMENDYFNSRIQIIDINSDKYIVIDNDSDTVTIELWKEAPFFQNVVNKITGFLDSVIMQNQGSSLPMLIALPLLILLLIGMLRKRFTGRQLIVALIFGTTVMLIAMLFTVSRSGHVVITNIPIKINWFYLAGIFIYTGFGELIFINAKNPKSKFIAVLVANLNLLVSFLLFAGAFLIQQFIFGNTFSINKFGYPWLLMLKELITGIVLYYTLYYLYNKLLVFRRKANPASETDKT